MAAWMMFCRIVYGGKIPKLSDITWPVPKSDWEDFLCQARPKVSSFKRFQCVVGNVCELGNRYFSNLYSKELRFIDPRVLYEANHRKCMRTLPREYGMGVKQIAPITMNEARNACEFADPFSIRGITICAAFTMGCLMGGRRPRTLTSVRLQDVTLRAHSVMLGGESCLVPKLHVIFTDEKFDDIQGPRESVDVPHFDDYETVFKTSPAFWVYRLLVLRGCFEEHDPIKSARHGDVLTIKPVCQQYFLFCESLPNYWIDACPVSVAVLGNMNKALLEEMGEEGRTFSAHRSGFVSRTCILSILKNKGLSLSDDTIEGMIRWGGWQAVTGAKTVLRIYARRVVNKFLDGYDLSLGYEQSNEEWLRRQKEYLGKKIKPEKDIIDRGRNEDHLAIRLLAWNSKKWQAFMKEINEACENIMSHSLSDRTLIPVRRYVDK